MFRLSLYVALGTLSTIPLNLPDIFLLLNRSSMASSTSFTACLGVRFLSFARMVLDNLETR
ncbi:hypothetical protein VCHA30O60_50121 [Vibrio chagasii]|nr:hypothetical protein VCHA30O60_50121 [Vibrio chagasii]